MSSKRRPRGCRDFGPEEMAVRREIEKRMRDTIEGFGYREISTPTFEHAELFVARSGPQVLEQMYTFKDKGGRELALRPELTAPVMRFFASDLKNESKPLRIYYFGNCFRYERPQKGRFREFWQIGLEYIGNKTPLANAEVITAAVDTLKSIGLRDFQLRIGNVSILKSLISDYGIDPDKDRELMTSLDKKDVEAVSRYLREKGKKETGDLVDMLTTTLEIEEAKPFLDRISTESEKDISGEIEELKEIIETVEGICPEIYLDPSISRGLDYYDGPVFEIDASSLGAEKQICGGGAYSLSSSIGSGVEGIGFGLGFDRVIMALNKEVEIGDGSEKTTFYLLPMGDLARRSAIRISSLIRGAGFTCILGTSDRGFKKAIKYALSKGCTHLAILGDREIENETISIKDLATESQKEISLEELGNYLRGLR